MAKIIKRVDVLVTEFMHEQQEVATLRKALDRTVRISRLSPLFATPDDRIFLTAGLPTLPATSSSGPKKAGQPKGSLSEGGLRHR